MFINFLFRLFFIFFSEEFLIFNFFVFFNVFLFFISFLNLLLFQFFLISES